MIRTPKILLIFLSGLLLSAPTFATSLLPVSLERMSKNAALIFYGTAINNEVKVDEVSGLVATLTAFEVIELIKGDTGNTHTIKQIGGQLAGSEIVHRIHGVPKFTIGKKYVVFMPQESSLGFASPLGLSQGRFVVSEQNGISTVNRGRAIPANLAATSNASAKIVTKKPGRSSLTEFLQTVRELAAE